MNIPGPTGRRKKHAASDRRNRIAESTPEKGRMLIVRPPVLLYLFLMLMLLWMWQDAFRQVARRTIPYSEFKLRLSKGELSDCTIEQDEITGKATPKPGAPAGSNGEKASVSRAFLVSERPRRGSQARRGSSECRCRAFSGVRPGSCRTCSGLGCCPSRLSRSSGSCWRDGSEPPARACWASPRAGRG